MEASVLRFVEKKSESARDPISVAGLAKGSLEQVVQLLRTGYVISIPEYWPEVTEMPVDSTDPRNVPATHPAHVARSGSNSVRHANSLVSANRQ